MLAPLIRYAPDVETLQPDEQKAIEQINSAFDEILTRTSQDYGHAVRSVHAKSHGRVGVIRALAQDNWDPAMVESVNEKMRFSVWTGLAAHQPLGNINRARREPYRHSADFRANFNRCPIHEPAE